MLDSFLFLVKKTRIEETEFIFDSPQPINDSELSSIPSKFKGEYNMNNESILYITDSLIFSDVIVSYHKSDIDSIGVFKNGKVICKKGNEAIDAVQDGDSIYLKMFRDTIFSFSPIQKAKRINGQMVLSYKDSVFWKIKIVSLHTDSLKIKYISTKKDYARLKPLVRSIKTNADTTVVHVNPTRKEFGKILRLKNLNSEGKYKRIK